MIFQRKFVQIIPIVNSLYLSFLYLEAFLFEKNIKQLTNILVVTLFTTPFILLILLNLKIVGKKNIFYIIKRNFFLLISLIIITIIFGVFIFNTLGENNIEIIYKTISIILEVIFISFAFKQEKEQRILKLIGYFSLCFFTGIAIYSIVGIFEKYIVLEKIEKSSILLFFGIFLHLFTACFLLYKFLSNKYNFL